MVERLWINNEYIPLSKNINSSLTKSITDIKQPHKRKATYSKSTRIPNSKEANKVFGSIFEINLTNGTFNPGVKADLRYEVNGENILEGYCQLKDIIQLDNKDIEYEIVMYGTIANIFRDMGEKYMDDVDMVAELDEWDHPFTREVQAFSWATQVWNNDGAAFEPFELGKGYVYPLADYGMSTNLDSFKWYHLPFAFYLKEYVDAIFDSNGYSYTSTFFNSTYFKSLIIPSSPTNYQLTSTDINNQEFAANTPIFASTGTSTSNIINPSPFFTAADIIEFSNEVSDPSGLYNPATGSYTIVSATFSGNYDINALIDINAIFTPTTGNNVAVTSDIHGALWVYVNGVQMAGESFYITYGDLPNTNYTAGARTTAVNPTYPSARVDYLDNTSQRYSQLSSLIQVDPITLVERGGVDADPSRYLLTMNNLYLNTGDVVTIRWKARYQGAIGDDNRCFKDSLGFYYTGTAQVVMSVGAFYNKSVNQTLAEGSTFNISKAIPKNIKQKDFFMSLVKMFNLWVDTDPDNPRNYIIEPRDDFLGTDIIECQTKLAQDRELKLTPMAKLNVAEYYFSYKQDKDYLNQKYETDHDRIFGDRYLNNVNDFVNSNQETKIIFSPTPVSAPPNKSRVMPTIIQLDDLGLPKSTDHNIRIWYYGGLKPGEIWTLEGEALLNETYTTYPYAGHWDDPFNPTEDINFGLVLEVYYDDNINTINVTNNNLVNKYYSQMLQTYTDKDSKIATGWFNVTPTDFREWTFDKLYHFENAFWRLQRIEGYNPTGEDLTKCVFLKLKEVPQFTATSTPATGSEDGADFLPGGSGGDLGFDEVLPSKGTRTSYNPDGNNQANRGVSVMGEDNLVMASAQFVDIQGDNNVVNGGTRNVLIKGSNNIVEPGLNNISLINTDGVTVTEDNITYVNGVIVLPAEDQWQTKDADFAAEDGVKGYYIDTSSGDITMDITRTTGNSDWIVKNVGTSNNQVTVSSSAAINIDGELSQELYDYESFRIRYNPADGEYKIVN